MSGYAAAPLLLALGLGIAACAPVRPARPAVSSARLIDEGRAQGLDLEDPLALDDEMKTAVVRAVGHLEKQEIRLRYLLRYLNDKGYVNFKYTPNQSLTAKQAFVLRQGDCMAYTHLFLALARHIGIDAYFVHVSEVKNYYERAGWFFVSSHVAVGAGHGPSAVVVDFSSEISDWQLSVYEAIDDSAALALFYNNVAVDRMVTGRTAEAEKLFRFLLQRQPSVAELHNNLGVLLNRSGRHEEALGILQEGLRRFPTYEPLFTNALTAARGAHRPGVVADLERRGQDIAQSDPFFLFARGISLYQDDRYALAAHQLERARDAKPDSPVILAWLTKAYLSAGRRQKGLEAFRQVKAMTPPATLLHDLEAQFPELKDVRAD